MEVLLQDLRFAFRQMGKLPCFTTLILLTLALGIGATARIFSVLDTVLLRPLSYAHGGPLPHPLRIEMEPSPV